MRKWRGRPSREETVPKSTYDTMKRERDSLTLDNTALKQEVARLQEQVADLLGKYTALGFDEGVARAVAQEAVALLQAVDTRRTGGVALQKKIDEIVARARHLGLVPEKREEKEDATSIQAVSQDDPNGRTGAHRS